MGRILAKNATLLLVLTGLSACASMGVSSRDPFESRLIALEQSAMKKRSNEAIIAEKERQEQARLARLDMELAMPNLSDGPDVIAPVAPETGNRRNKTPIGRISPN